MTDQPFLSARIDGDGTIAIGGDRAASVPWWSFTKTALATAALQLVARGLCSLDRRVDRQPYTLRQLLQHRAGVPNYGNLADYHEAVRCGDKPWEPGELLTRVASDRLDFAPGTGWRYSNVGYFFVRQIIENAAGEDIGSALRHLIFDRLNLASVRLATSPQDLAETAWGNDTGYDPGWVYHGLLMGTPEDAVRFLHSLVSGVVLPAALLTEMTTRHPIDEKLISSRPWETAGYGLGLMMGRMASVGSAIGHSGGGPGSVSAVYHFGDVARPCTVAAFCRGDNEGVTEYEVARLARAD
jgi:CubicO group peptidase (beta-lactamase class C family)